MTLGQFVRLRIIEIYCLAFIVYLVASACKKKPFTVEFVCFVVAAIQKRRGQIVTCFLECQQQKSKSKQGHFGL